MSAILKVTGEVDDSKLPDDLAYLKPKLKNKNFSVLKLQTIQDQQLQDQLENIQKDAQAHAGEGQPSFKWDQQDDPYAGMMSTFMLFLLPMLVLGALFFFVLPRFRDPLGGGFLSNYIKSPAKRYERSRNRITFDDVAGLQNSKSELMEVVEFLRNPREIPAPRRRRAQGRPVDRAARNRQDALGQGGGRRSGSAFLQH